MTPADCPRHWGDYSMESFVATPEHSRVRSFLNVL